MKKYVAYCVLTIIVLGTLTISTAKVETPFDGNDTYGFPFEFYKIYGGKRTYYPPNEFSIIKFGLDIMVAVCISFVIMTIIKTIKPPKKSGT